MVESRYKIPRVEHLLGYFDLQVLAAYKNEPNKYVIETNDLGGRLKVTEEYYSKLENEGKLDEVVNIRFGYRALKNGNRAVVAWLPDLRKSKAHIRQWEGFRLENPEWALEDELFEKWIQRYLEGRWEVDGVPLPELKHIIEVINALTSELVGIPLYKYELDERLGYPAAENTYQYQEAHKVLYGYLIDGLDKKCISRLASKLGKTIHVGDKRTVKALQDIFPNLGASPFASAMELVSKQRRLASHGVPSRAADFSAFSQFAKDITLCLGGARALLETLEREFGVNGEHALQRRWAKKGLPRITHPPEPHYSIVRAKDMVGKTVEKVKVGFREKIEGVHGSEALIIYFTDGSIMSIETGSNVENLINSENHLRAEDFHVDFVVNWVPALKTDKSS